jgi:hypothetical protein
MTYSLIQLAPGAYDLLLNGEVMGRIVRNGSRQLYTWTAELLEHVPRSKRPAPFREVEYDFPTLEELRAWLSSPMVTSSVEKSLEVRRI